MPWLVSAILLLYVFGHATDWQRLVAAMQGADLPRFLFFATADRLAFFFVWTWLSALALQRFAPDVPIRSVFAVRGGSELARAVSNPLSDAAFFMGLVRLSDGRIDAAVASTLIPLATHFLVMLVQVTLALPFQEGGLAGSPGLATGMLAGWALAAALAAAVLAARSGRIESPVLRRIERSVARLGGRELVLFLWAFAALALFDVHIQWLASRAFGMPIDWTAMAARLPALYVAFLIPTLGNFGTRELAWAGLFDEFGDRDHLIAYGFSVNAIFLVLNVLIGVLFLSRALQLLRRVPGEGESPSPTGRTSTSTDRSPA